MSYIDDILTVAEKFRVFPVDPATHAPMMVGWQKWATQDEAKIRSYWAENKTDHVAILTGKPSGIFVVDLDRKKGKDGLKHIKKFGAMDCDFQQKTQSNGFHLFYTYEEGIRNKTDWLKEERGQRTGVDIRGDGGYVVTWPSEKYAWRDVNAEVGAAPEWMSTKLKRKKEAKTNTNGRRMDQDELSSTLATLEPSDYQDRESWMRIMIMTKSACGGESWGKDMFRDWSLMDQSGFSSDPVQYIDEMWPTIDSDREDGLSANSFSHEIRQQRLAHEAEEFGDDEQELLPIEPLAAAKAPAKPTKPALGYTARVKSEEDLGEEVWTRQFNKSLERKVLVKNEGNLIQFLLQRKLPKEFGSNPNPLCEVFRYNELRQSVVYGRTPPWAIVGTSDRVYKNREMQDQDITELRNYVDINFGLAFAKAAADSAVLAAAHRTPFHPAREYCECLDWDMEERLETWLIQCGGVEDTPYNRAVSKKMLISVVARIYKPGCKVDTIPVLEGPQGFFKSTMLSVLGGEWYSSPEIKIGDKDAEQNLQGSVIVEWAEFAYGFREMEAFKAWCSKGSNKFRGSYGKQARDWPRTCVIFVTMNPDGDGCYLLDATGNRRMWPLRLTKPINLDWVKFNRDQLFAEAVAYYKSKEIWHLSDQEARWARDETDQRMIRDPWEDPIHNYLYVGGGKNLDRTSIADLAFEALDIPHSKCQHRESRKIGRILRALGWSYVTYRSDGTRVRGFTRPVHEDRRSKRHLNAAIPGER